MPHYRRNRLRSDVINRQGPTAGLPLFDSKLKEPVKSRFENAPMAMALATDTRKLGHISATHDVVQLGDKQQKVLDVILDCGPVSNSEIAHQLGWPINQVVGRTYELREYGLVIPDEKRKCRITGMVVQTWRVK